MKNLLILLATMFALSSCETEDVLVDIAAFENGTTFTVVNTIQIAAPDSMGGTNGVELPLETLVGAPAGSLTGEASLSESEVELPGFITLWDLDFGKKSITFNNLITPANEPFPGFLRVLEAGTYDRYYITTSEAFIIDNVDINIPVGVTIDILSDTELLIVFGEGYDNTQSTVQIDLN